MNYSKMKNLIRLLLVILLPAVVHASMSRAGGDIEIHGTLVDKSTGQPISGAVVTIDNSYAYALTDAKGNFSFSHIHQQNVTLHINHVAYQPITQAIMEPSGDVKLEMQSKEFLSDEVTVTATRADANSAVAYT